MAEPLIDVGGGVRADVASSLLQATEAAALKCARSLGRGDADRVRESAAAAMFETLERLGVGGRLVLGPRSDRIVFQGETLGDQERCQYDLGVYPVEGASLVARGLPGAISVLIAVASGDFPTLPAVWYAEKIVSGRAARGALDLDDPLADNLRRIAFARDVRVTDIAVAVMDRPRHRELIEEVRDAGARVVLLEEGEIAGALLAAAEGTGIDALVGIGGLPETIMAACAVQCMGGEIQARLWPRNDEERLLAGDEVGRTYGLNDLAPERVDLAVTGVSGGPLLRAVWYGTNGAETESLCASTRLQAVRRIRTVHQRVSKTI